jgi:site-specific recombinase XerD
MVNMKGTYPSDPRWPCLRWDTDRHGNLRCYYRDTSRPGSKQPRLRAAFGTPAFAAEYDAAEAAVRAGEQPTRRVEKCQEPIKPKPVGAKSVNALLAAYYKGDHWLNNLGDKSRRNRLTDFSTVFDMVKDGRTLGERSYLTLDTYAVRAIYKEIAATKRGKAISWLTGLSTVFDWALESCFDTAIKVNPCKGIKRLPLLNPNGHLQWEPEHIHKFRDYYGEGSEADNAMIGFLYTGARRSDFVEINDDMIFDAIDAEGRRRKVISFEPIKNRERKLREGKPITPAFIPILPPLQKLLDARPDGQSHLFVNAQGKPVQRNTMTRKMHRWIRAMDWGDDGPPKLVPHGLRKACTTFLLQAKVAAEDIAAIMGWDDVSMVRLYGKNYDREAGALRGMPSFTIPAPRQRRVLRVVGKAKVA